LDTKKNPFLNFSSYPTHLYVFYCHVSSLFSSIVIVFSASFLAGNFLHSRQDSVHQYCLEFSLILPCLRTHSHTVFINQGEWYPHPGI
jgi:hypothetical protein